ncbi:MAG: ROK family protein [Planctomycetota bacterium]
MTAAASPGPKTLTIDIGGTGLKAGVLDAAANLVGERVRVDTPYPCSPQVMLDALLALVRPLQGYARVSVGWPGVVRNGKVVTAPHYGTELWAGYDLASALSQALGAPVRLLNDADLQGLGAIEGKGVELVVTLGTGVGTALFEDGRLLPHLELAHHQVWKGKTYNEYVGDKARKKLDKSRWNRRVARVVETLRALIHPDRIHIGGGNAKRVTFDLAPDTRLVDNTAALQGGVVVWSK